MAVIKTIAVNLIAKTSSFERGMKRGQVQMTRFQRTAAATSAVIKTLATTLGLFAGAAVAGAMVRSSFQIIDATAKMSDRLKIATEDIIGMRHAAGIMGASAETMDKALEIFVRRLGEVRMGSGEAKRGLEALGLSADKLVKLSPAAAFRSISDEINKMSNQADKAATAYFLFGRQGTQLINTMSLGSEGLREMQREAENLGLTFSRLDASRVEEANDAILKMRGVFKGLSNDFAVTIAPTVTSLGEFIIRVMDVIKGSLNIIVSLGQTALAGITALVGGVIKAVEKLLNVMTGMESGVGDIVLELARDFKDLADVNIEQAMEQFARAFSKSGGLSQFLPKLPKLPDLLDDVADSITTVDTEMQQLTRTVSTLLEGIKTPQQKMDDFLDLIDRAFMESLITAEQGIKLIEQAYNRIFKIDQLKAWADAIKQSLKGPTQLLKDFRNKAASAFFEGLLSAAEVEAAIAKKTAELFPQAQTAGIGGGGGGISGRGESRAIRTAFVNVGGLANRGASPQVRELEKTNQLLRTQNQILRTIEDQEIR